MSLALHPALKRVLIVFAKNGVNAVLVNTALMAQWHSIFNFDNLPGVWAVTRATLSVIAAREALVWIPVLFKWSSTDADPGDLGAAISDAKDAASQAKEAASKTQEAIAHVEEVTPKALEHKNIDAE
jgi:hypothetical protein